MESNPGILISSLYKNDPFYPLYLCDLMEASQAAVNSFLKEQKTLLWTLKKLEHQRSTRLRQLNEEKKQFALLMERKLAPQINNRSSSHFPGVEISQSSSSSSRIPPSRKNTLKSFHAGRDIRVISSTPSSSTESSEVKPVEMLKVPLSSLRIPGPQYMCKYVHNPKLLTRNGSYLPILRL